ncbi:isocitrate lyase/PEP mutase family protein [Oryzihumus leptocrescens]|uniref:2-methylisocitrate lyase-like PEP mutase family enzyme n=1 Tax=Oryzihumus leptocrescens TaxID=297536 RepID=A0A542Z967_9MICO|nr:isocitrate lyase/phosphoenolpyruvate mutase family protein [Oryzihumus leptocrescens]TQL56842.1 2-methylisocitrate lyase-like PEP mutase family enzyme [Oryzihumus leptocrescens]
MTTSTGPVSSAAERFHQLHQGPILVLPNAWDVASARLVEDAGAAAVATTSAGLSWSWGVADGEELGLETTLDLTRRVVHAVDVPVTTDLEAGYAHDLDGLAANVRAVLDAGAVGVNFEDGLAGGLRPVEGQVARIAAVRQEAGAGLYVNARTDTYLRAVGAPEDRLDETVRRAEAYLGAGASGIFVPGLADLRIIEALVARIPAPVNILVGPGSPTIRELAEVGVARASAGSAIAQAVYGHVQRAAAELLGPGTYTELAGAADYPTMNALLSR